MTKNLHAVVDADAGTVDHRISPWERRDMSYDAWWVEWQRELDKPRGPHYVFVGRRYKEWLDDILKNWGKSK